MDEETAKNKNMDIEAISLQDKNDELPDSDVQLNTNVISYTEESEFVLNQQNLLSVNPPIQNKPFEYNELDKEIEEFKSNQNNDIQEEPKLSKIELLKQKLSNIKPRLSGGPNEVIDLETGITVPDEIYRLKERFLQQMAKKHVHKNVKLK